MSAYQIIGTAPNVSEIQLNSTFLNNDYVEIDGATYNSIGSGSGPIDITGVNAAREFKVRIVNLGGNFTLKPRCFQGLNITEFLYPTPQTQTFVIEDSVFRQSKLTKFTLPNITNPASLGNGIFYQCTTLTDFSFGLNNVSNIDNIPEETFYGCTALNTLTIPEYIVTINAYAFKAAIIQTLTLSSGLITIGSNAFYQTTIPQLIIPDSVTSIGVSAFENSNIPIITINETSALTTIGMCAFKQSKMREFYFPETLVKIDSEAFGESSLIEVNLPIFTNYCEFVGYTFNASSQIQSVVIGGKISSTADSSGHDILPNQMFTGCVNLKSVQLYNGLKQISSFCFSSCLNLQDIVFQGTTPLVLGENCFYNCGFDYLHLPAHINNIGEGVFGSCTKLKQVIIEAATPTLVGDVFGGSNLMTELILSTAFTDFANADSFIVPNLLFRFYVFTQTQKESILKYAKYTGLIEYKPYHHRNFINVKAIYDDEHDPGYVMYIMASSGNTFNDCTFYFKEGSSPKPIVVIKQEGNMTNCVKMYSAITDDDDKTISKIYYNTERTRWEVLLSGGTIKLPEDIDQTYQLQDNFECPSKYDGTVVMSIDGSSLKQCDMFDLSNLTNRGYVTLNSIDRIKLTSTRNNKTDEYQINLLSTTGNQIFEVVDVDCAKLQLFGNTIATLIMEGTVKTRSYAWSIEAPKIIVNNLTINYTLFQGQQQGVGEALLTKIECTGMDLLIKFTADTVINFYTIQNKNNYMFDNDTQETNALYYVSGWTMM